MTGSLFRKCRGALIVLEGCDRSGKSTQCSKLVSRLQQEGKEVKLWKFPDRTTVIGQMIDRYLKQTDELDDHTVHLLFSANRWEAMNEMSAQLDSGTTLIVDRYAYSGVAFTAAKGLDAAWCKQPDVGLIKPDCVLYLTVNNEQAAQRCHFGQERYEKQDFQKQADAVFSLLKDDSYWKTIDGNAPIDAVHKNIYDSVLPVLEEVKEKPLFRLWADGLFDSGLGKAADGQK